MFQSSLDEVLHEVDDLDQEPGEDEIREYAELIGIDPDKEPELLWIARAGITAPLPADWKPIQVNNGDELYFYNFKTGESSWEHPSDDKYRQLVLEERNKKSQQKPKTSGGLPPATATGKPPIGTPSASTAAAAIAALKPVKQPGPPPSTVGKLAPIGGTPSGPTSGPPGKLQPIGASPSSAPSAPKPSGKTLAPIGATTQELERPKTSRGPSEKEKAPEPQPQQRPLSQPAPSAVVLGGGSRFLKKNEDHPPDSGSAKEDGDERKIVQNVLRFPSEESDSESDSSLHSGSLSLPGGDKEHLVLDLDELKPAAAAPPPVPAYTASKPPVAPKQSTPVSSTTAGGKEWAKVEPPKPASVTPSRPPAPVLAPMASTPVSSKPPAPDKPKVQSTPAPAPAPVIVNETPRKTSSDTSDSADKVERQLQEDYERRVKQLREQHDAKLKDVRAKFEEEEKKETEKIKKAMDDRLRSYKDKLQKDEENETKSLNASHKKQLDELRSKLEKERAETEKQLRLKLNADLQETERELSQRSTRSIDNAAAREERGRLEADHMKAVESLKKNFEKELAEEERRHGSEKKRRMDELRDRLQKELDEWYRKEKERKMAVLKNDIDKELGDVKKTLEAERRSALEAEASKDTEHRRRQIEEQHERRIAELRREHDDEISRLRRKNKELMDDEIIDHRRQSERVRGEAFDDLRHRQEDALKTAEQQLKSFRDELSALTRMTADIRYTLQPAIAESSGSNRLDQEERPAAGAVGNGARKAAKKSEKSKIDPAKAAVVKSIDDLISPDANGVHSSRTGSSLEQKLGYLESEDVLEKVTRFLESQKAVGAQPQHRSSSLQRQPSNRRDDFSGGAEAAHVGATRSVNGSLLNFRNNAMADRVPAESHRRENVFRAQPKDAIDEFLDRKVKEYFHAHNAISNIRDRPLWMPSGVSHYQSRYFTNRRRAYDVESELNSLKRWLNEFETRISDKAAVAQSRPPPLHIGEQNRVLSIEGSAGRSGAAQGMSFLNDEEVVEI